MKYNPLEDSIWGKIPHSYRQHAITMAIRCDLDTVMQYLDGWQKPHDYKSLQNFIGQWLPNLRVCIANERSGRLNQIDSLQRALAETRKLLHEETNGKYSINGVLVVEEKSIYDSPTFTRGT